MISAQTKKSFFLKLLYISDSVNVKIPIELVKNDTIEKYNNITNCTEQYWLNIIRYPTCLYCGVKVLQDLILFHKNLEITNKNRIKSRWVDNEISILSTLKNVQWACKLFIAYRYQNIGLNGNIFYSIYSEMYNGITVKSYIKYKKEKEFDIFFQDFYPIMMNILYDMRVKKLFHRNLSSSNVLYNYREKTVKIIDFKMAIYMDKNHTDMSGINLVKPLIQDESFFDSIYFFYSLYYGYTKNEYKSCIFSKWVMKTHLSSDRLDVWLSDTEKSRYLREEHLFNYN